MFEAYPLRPTDNQVTEGIRSVNTLFFKASGCQTISPRISIVILERHCGGLLFIGNKYTLGKLSCSLQGNRLVRETLDIV